VSTASRKGWIVKGLLSLGLLSVLAFTLDSLVFSDATFTSGSANVASATAGDLRLANTRDGQLLIDAAGLVPGDVRSGSMTLTGEGDLAGQYVLSASGLVDTPSSPRLSDALSMTVEDGTTGATLYDGPVSGFSSADLGAIAPGEAHTYSVTLTYPEGTDDSRLQDATMVLSLRVVGVTS
jgi:hypothetical protein